MALHDLLFKPLTYHRGQRTMYVYLSNSVRIAVKRGFTLEDSVNSTQITINIPGKYGLVNVQNGLNLYLNVRCIFCNF